MRTLYHSSPAKFAKFWLNAPLTFFFEDEDEAQAIWANTYVDCRSAYLYVVSVPDEVFTKLIKVNDYNIEADIVSNPSYKEINEGPIGAYIEKAKVAGAMGLIIRDYSQIDNQKDATSFGLFPEAVKQTTIRSIKAFG
jgi:hypothetical protein